MMRWARENWSKKACRWIPRSCCPLRTQGRLTAEVGGRANLFLTFSEPNDEQRLPEAARERRSVRICGDEAPYGEAFGPSIGLFERFHYEVPRSYANCETSRKSATPHARQLRQNRAANATCTGYVGTRTPEKAGSVSNETHPRAPQANTRTPRSRDTSSKTISRPAAVKAKNSRTHQSGSHQSSPSSRPSTVPTSPSGKATLRRGPPSLPVQEYKPARPPRNKPGVIIPKTGTTTPRTNL